MRLTTVVIRTWATAVALAFTCVILVGPASTVHAVGLPVAQSLNTPFLEECSPWGNTPLKAQDINSPPQLVLLELLGTWTPEERKLETPIQFSVSRLFVSALWDSIASYNDTAKPMLDAAAVPRQPVAARTNANMNTALCFALLRVNEAVLPSAVPAIQALMTRLKLNPGDTSTDTSTGVGVGNTVGKAWVQYASTDGMNKDGNMDHKYNRQAYSDYTGYIPENDADRLTNLTKWQPLMETNGFGYFTIQTHIAPQTAAAKAFSLSPAEVAAAKVAAPYPPGQPSADTLKQMKAKTDQVLQVSAALTDRQKVTAEFFDDKLVSLGAIPVYYALTRFLDIHTVLGLALSANCVYDSTVVAWKEKLRHAVRPTSLVRYFYGDQTVKAWAGRDAGTQNIPGNEWTSYLRTMPHAEYPSGTACACAAWGEFMTKAIGTDTINPPISFTIKKGCSRREPGTTPGSDLQFDLKSVKAIVRICAMSRLQAGVHFQDSIDAGKKLCAPLGNKCFAKYESLKK